MWGKHSDCSHIINIFEETENNSKHKGNLYLSGVYALNDPVKDNFGINSVLTIIDKWAYQCFEVTKKLQKNNIKHHKWINLDDADEEDIFPFFEEAHAFIKEMLQEQNVLVHCQMGISRSSSLVIAYLMKEFKLSYSKARALVQSKRKFISPNKGFTQNLMKYQKHLQQQAQSVEVKEG